MRRGSGAPSPVVSVTRAMIWAFSVAGPRQRRRQRGAFAAGYGRSRPASPAVSALVVSVLVVNRVSQVCVLILNVGVPFRLNLKTRGNSWTYDASCKATVG